MKFNRLRVFIIGIILFLAGFLVATLEEGHGVASAQAQNEKHWHLLLAHNLPSDHPVHLGMLDFANRVREKSSGRIDVTIYPNGQIGSEKEVLELVQLGAISMTKVSSLSLESFTPILSVLNLPFLFRDREHMFRVLDSEIGNELLLANPRLHGLTYYDAGDRSFYATAPIRRPEDMKGMKIRVMESSTAIRMVQLLGGSPSPMPYGEVYTALQQGVIDGAENNITALWSSRHGEVAKYYSRLQQVFSPDILVISQRIWKDMSESDQALLKEAAEQSKIDQRILWQKQVQEFEDQAQSKMGVRFLSPDRQPFIDLVQPLQSEMRAQGPDFARLIDAIQVQ